MRESVYTCESSTSVKHTSRTYYICGVGSCVRTCVSEFKRNLLHSTDHRHCLVCLVFGALRGALARLIERCTFGACAHRLWAIAFVVVIATGSGGAGERGAIEFCATRNHVRYSASPPLSGQPPPTSQTHCANQRSAAIQTVVIGCLHLCCAVPKTPSPSSSSFARRISSACGINCVPGAPVDRRGQMPGVVLCLDDRYETYPYPY